MLENTSTTAADEPWGGFAAKEKDKANESKEGVENLKTELNKSNIKIINVDEFSNQVIAEIFNHIITVCKANLK